MWLYSRVNMPRRGLTRLLRQWMTLLSLVGWVRAAVFGLMHVLGIAPLICKVSGYFFFCCIGRAFLRSKLISMSVGSLCSSTLILLQKLHLGEDKIRHFTEASACLSLWPKGLSQPTPTPSDWRRRTTFLQEAEPRLRFHLIEVSLEDRQLYT